MFIEVEVKPSIIMHGYNTENKEIEEVLQTTEFTKKILAISRIQSISEDYILVTSSHGRVMYWQYKSTMEALKEKLLSIGVKIA